MRKEEKKMMYTKQELNVIRDVTCEIGNYSDAAIYMLDDFCEKYLVDEDRIENFIRLLKRDPARINIELFAIGRMLVEVKRLVDTYTGADSYRLKRYFEEAEERKQIFDTINEAV